MGEHSDQISQLYAAYFSFLAIEKTILLLSGGLSQCLKKKVIGYRHPENLEH